MHDTTTTDHGEMIRRLHAARRELLDLSTRNRLLDTPRHRTRSSSIEIHDERSRYVFQQLVTDGRSMSFLPRTEEAPTTGEEPEPTTIAPEAEDGADAQVTASEDPVAEQPASVSAEAHPAEGGPAVRRDADRTDDPTKRPVPTEDRPSFETADTGAIQGGLDDAEPFADLPQPNDTEEAAIEDETPAPRHVDTRLQTDLPSEKLQRQLLKTYYAARTYEEEQGVSVLFLALGFLKWFDESDPSKARHAPLLLVPVRIERRSAGSRFRIAWTGEEIATNLSLQVKLHSAFGIDLPEVPEEEDVDPSGYFDTVERAIGVMDGWEVLRDDIVLWFFAFSKLLMYRDLDPANWPDGDGPAGHPLVRALLETGLDEQPALCDADANIDALIDPLDMIHVMDADSSQSLVIEEVRRGRNLVVQGPPGTGKSQTIANLIASAVQDGKRILFVAEKMAALDVVRRRLDNIDLGAMCLPLHSNRANKRVVLDDLQRTLELQKPVVDDVSAHADALRETRDRLNDHAELMHRRFEPSGCTPYQAIGELARLTAAEVPPADFQLESAEAWTSAEYRVRREAIAESLPFIEQLGTPARHPWRGVMLDAILPMDVDRIEQRLPEAIERARAACDQIASFASAMSIAAPKSTADVRRLIEFARGILAWSEGIDRARMADPVWERHREDIHQLVEAGIEYGSCRDALEDLVVDAAWSTDVTSIRRDLAAHGRSPFRMFNGAYRRARSTLAGICRDRLPNQLRQRLDLLDTIASGREAKRMIESAADLGQRAFGSLWRGESSNFEELATIERADAELAADPDRPADHRRVIASIPEPGGFDEFNQLVRTVDDASTGMMDAIRPIIGAVTLDLRRAFGNCGLSDDPRPADVPLDALLDRLEAWRADPNGIMKWIPYRVRADRLRDQGLTELGEALDEGRLRTGEAIDRFDAAYFEIVLRRMMHESPELASFDGMAHERLLDRFRSLDRQRIVLARQQVALSHYDRIPRGAADIGELGVLRHEFSKKRRHLPLRRLLRRAGNAVTTIKPVFMMSPLSIAQYLEPGALEFDLLLIDEASQVRPVDALGAVARAKQTVVVGDDKQLPPTRFFATELDDDEGQLDEMRAGDLESILGLCRAQGVPQRMLRWHYRSRHHSLIAVSNHAFYNERLYVIPSPDDDDGRLGLKLHHIANGVFDRGGTATNPAEASVVAQAVMRHAERSPEVTLGVGTFSVKQRDAILDQLERLRRASPRLESFFSTDRPEPFFVKNLENIQGDERDVIFISVGYGRDANGFVSMNFGPLSAEGGERRLNVLITRARRRCEVFTSMTADEIDLTRATGRGPATLKTFLAFADTQRRPTVGEGEDDARSSLEQTVAGVIAAHGYDLDHRVGVAGLHIDLAVRDREREGAYALGIALDGASYHDARSVRDRDRLRPQVLEDRGWINHRIWAVDWLRQPSDQLRRVVAAIEAAMSDRRTTDADDDEDVASTSPPEEPESLIRRAAKDSDSASISVPYTEAAFDVPAETELHELSPANLARHVMRIVKIEGPIHRDEVVQRVRTLWGYARTGARIVNAVNAALEHAEHRGAVHRDGEFFSASSDAEVAVRDRSGVRSSTLRSVAMLPPAEIRTCADRLVRQHPGATRDETIQSTARLLGFRSTSRVLRDLIDRQINRLVSENAMTASDARLYATEDDKEGPAA